MENKNKLKIGIAGVGHLGTLHLKMLLQSDNCTVTGIYDGNIENLNKKAEEFGVKAFENYDQFLEHCEAVSIAVSTPAHYEIAKQALLSGRHIFIEKPITSTIDEAVELCRIADERGLKIQVGHIERFNPAILAVEKYSISPLFIQTDRLAQFNPRGSDVAVVLDLMIHDIDLILSLIKSKVVKIDASGVAVVSDYLDIANARIEFENGAVAVVTASRISQKKMRKMRIFQKDHYISLDFNSGVAEVFRLVDPKVNHQITGISFGSIGTGENIKSIVYEQPEVVEINALKHELSLFIDAVLNDTTPVVSGVDGLEALKIAEQIIKKIEESAAKLKV